MFLIFSKKYLYEFFSTVNSNYSENTSLFINIASILGGTRIHTTNTKYRQGRAVVKQEI